MGKEKSKNTKQLKQRCDVVSEENNSGADITKISNPIVSGVVEIQPYEIGVVEKIINSNDDDYIKSRVKEWIAKFIACDSYGEICEVVKSYNVSPLCKERGIDVDFFIWQYVFYYLKDKIHSKIIIEYISKAKGLRGLYLLCDDYNPYDVLDNCEYLSNKHKGYLYNYIKSLNIQSRDTKPSKVFFDIKSHYCCECDSIGHFRFFENYDDLLEYKNKDLISLGYTQSFTKGYSEGKFKVAQEWYNSYNTCVKRYTYVFDFFYDFVAFLKGDLSGADLSSCEDLYNVADIFGLDFSDAKVPKSFCDKFGIYYEDEDLGVNSNKFLPSTLSTKSFELTEKNEKCTALVLQSSRELSYAQDKDKERIYYISDLHLIHKLQNLGLEAEEDIKQFVQSVVNSIISDIGSELSHTLLIGGDVSSNFEIFTLFVRLLKEGLKQSFYEPNVIFVLGNHELWAFPNPTFDEIVDKYDRLLSKNGMYLLQNNIFYKGLRQNINEIGRCELLAMTEEDIRNRLRLAQVVFLGGVGFSGYNEEFNAYTGIYRKVISREDEVKESKAFEELYNKILKAIPDKNVVVFTHMPMECWNVNPAMQKGYTYVNGHTHRNWFYDDGESCIYADNQIGYKNKNFHLKWFDMDKGYDYFSDYEDGIYEITKRDYQEFCCGKNIGTIVSWKVNTLYMLKKKGYYCFIHKTKDGSLAILNGGNRRCLESRDIDYYYDNMDKVIAKVGDPLDKYISFQKEISEVIQRIGGTGRIHGCIVDIDFYNHVYVNPYDMKITGYWALDMEYKLVYPCVASLLEEKCPEMYKRYVGLLDGGYENSLVPIFRGDISISSSSQLYLEKEIYKISRELRKLQKLKVKHSV